MIIKANVYKKFYETKNMLDLKIFIKKLSIFQQLCCIVNGSLSLEDGSDNIRMLHICVIHDVLSMGTRLGLNDLGDNNNAKT